MPDSLSPADEAVLQRRGFLRGGALLAAAAGGAVVASAGSVLPAAADSPDLVALTVGIPPTRFLDTRTDDGRDYIVASSKSALDSKNRLKKDAWIDVAVYPADQDIDLVAVFVNLSSHSPAKAGSLVVTEPDDDKPSGWTLSYGKGKTVSNGAIAGVGLSDDETVFTVRVYASAPTHVMLNLTGVSAILSVDTAEPALARTSNRASVARIVRAAKSLRR